MAVVSIKKILEAGAHYGHLARRWHPKMDKYIYGLKHGVHIIDLQQTLRQLKKAYLFVRDVSAKGESVLFAATKRQAREIIQEEADRCGAYYINGRWLGGLLTNFKTVRLSINALKRIDERRGEDGLYEGMIKKEAGLMEKRRLKLEQALGGIKPMNRLPGVLFVIDCNKESLALQEARKLNMPIVAVVDTNCDPSNVDYVIPGNDDSIRSIRLFAGVIASAVLEGKEIYEARRLEIDTTNKARNAAKTRKPKATKPVAKTDAAKPAETAKPAEVASAPKPAETASAAKPAAKTDAAKPAETAKPAEIASAAKPAAKVDAAKPAETAKPAEIASAAKPAAKVDAAKPAETAKPVEKVTSKPIATPEDGGEVVQISAKVVMGLRAATGAGMMECKAALQETNGDIEAAKEHLRIKGIAVAQKKAGREANEGAIAIVLAGDKSQAAMVRMACETDFVARNEQFQGLLQRITKQVVTHGEKDLLSQKPAEGEGDSLEAVLTEGIRSLGENLRIEESVRVAATAEGVLGSYVHTNQKVAVLVRLQASAQKTPAALEELARDLAMHAAAMPVLAVEEKGIEPRVLAQEKSIAEAQFAESGKPEKLKDKIVEGRMRKFVQENTLLGQPFVKNPKKTVADLLSEMEKIQGGSVSVAQLIKYQV